MTLRSRLLAAMLFTLAAGVPARAQAQAAPCTPEPMSMSLLAIGLVGLGSASVRRWRKQ